jgi:hypothetical protein
VRGGRLRTCLLIAALVAPAALPLFVEASISPPRLRLAAEMLDGHDPGFDVLRTAQIDRGLRTAQFPVRWTPDMASGYGQPLFLYYSPGPYYLAEAFHLLGFRFVSAVKMAYLAGFLLAAGFSYLLGRDLWGAGAGWALAALYTYAPYHLVDVYVRSSLGESLAFAWPPLVLWGAWRFARDGRAGGWFASAAGIAALPLTHNIAALLLFPLLSLFIALLGAAPEIRARRWGLAGILAAGLGAAAWFWLPALAELGDLPGEFTSNQFHFSQHFALPWQLLSRDWGFDLVEHPGDPGGMSMQVGWIQLAAVVAAFALAWRARAAALPARRWLLLALAAAPACALMMLPASRPIWDAVPSLALVQLPWRFLLPLAAMTSLAGAAVPRLAPGARGHAVAAAILVGAAVLASLPYCQARYRPAPADAAFDRAGFLTLPHPYSTTSLQMEYLPRGVRRLPDRPATELFLAPPGCAFDQVRLGSDRHFLDAVCTAPGVVSFRQFAFPGWTVWVDKREVPFMVDPEEGTLSFAIPEGAHRVKVALRDTPVRRGATLLSLATIVGTLAAWHLRRAEGGR